MADQPQQPSQGWGLPSDGTDPPETPRPEYAYSPGPPPEPRGPGATSTTEAPPAVAPASPNGPASAPEEVAGTGFGRFVPPPDELDERLASVKTKTVTPEPIAEPEPDMGVKPDEAPVDADTTIPAAGAAAPTTAADRARAATEGLKSRRRALVIGGVLLLALIIVALIATNTVDVRSPQETAQDPTTTTSEPPETSPPTTTLPFDESLSGLTPSATYRYNAPTPPDAMVAFIASVQQRNVTVLEGLLDPEADIPAVEAKANAMLALPLTTLDGATRAVTCTISGTEARCTAAGITGESLFRQDATSWRLVS